MLKANQVYYYKLMQHIKQNRTHHVMNVPTIPRYSFRQHHLRTPKIRTNYGKQLQSYQAPSLLNRLPEFHDKIMEGSNDSFKIFLISDNIEFV